MSIKVKVERKSNSNPVVDVLRFMLPSFLILTVKNMSSFTQTDRSVISHQGANFAVFLRNSKPKQMIVSGFITAAAVQLQRDRNMKMLLCFMKLNAAFTAERM